jgi:hypothetical protein
MATNRNRAGLLTESSTLFPNNITQEISPQDLRDWIADGTTSFVTQKDKSTLENAIYEARSSALASAATTDLSTASGNYVHITGTTTITSFGTCSPGSRFVLVFDGVLTLTYNATSLIIPGAANKTTAAGDACMIISEGSGNWKIVGYFSISGSGGGGGTPGGADGQIQYNNGGSFGGVNHLTWDDVTNVLLLKNPTIGGSPGNGHFHMHSINVSAPSGVTDYVTIYADKSPKQIGTRFETDAYTSALQFGATANRVYSLPDATGNVLVDTVIPSLNNGTSAGEIRLKEATANGSNYVAIKSPASLAADYSLTLPADDGGSGQVLLTDGSGVLSWANAGPIGSKYISTTSVNTLASGTAFTVFVSLEIPANTFGNGSIFRILQRTLRPTSGTAATIRLGFNTAISTSGANMVWLSSAASTINAGAFTGTTQRHISIEGTTTSYYLAGWGSASNDDVIFAYNPAQTAAIDWTVTQYLIIGASTGASDTMQNIFTSITPLS